MYHLYRISDNEYQIHSCFSNEKAMEGTLKSIWKYCVHELKFDSNELEFGIMDMNVKDNNSAQFGINRNFLFSFSKEFKKVG